MKRGARPGGPIIGRCTSTTTTADEGGRSSAAFFFLDEDVSEDDDEEPALESFLAGLVALALSARTPAFALTYSFNSFFASATVDADGPRRAPGWPSRTGVVDCSAASA